MADLGIADARVREDDVSAAERQQVREFVQEKFVDTPDDEREAQIEALVRDIFGSRQTVELIHRSSESGVPLPFQEESLGTKSWLAFVSYALDALDNGGALLVDELDASLHPVLIAEALQLFQNRRSNRFGAQLVFTTHDVTILGNTLERLKLARGQIWLTEKGEDGSSSLTPLSDYRPRKGEDLERGYLQGRYGGTPQVASSSAGTLATSLASAIR